MLRPLLTRATSCALALLTCSSAFAWNSQLFQPESGTFRYRPVAVDFGGRRWQIPDYSQVGYRLGTQSLASDVPCYEVTVSATGDITSALQSAIDTVGTAGGGSVYIPAGSFTVSRSVSVPYSRVSIIGAGSSRTHLSVPASYVATEDLYEGLFTLGKAIGGYARGWTTRSNVLTTVVSPIAEGAYTATLANAGSIKIGQWIVLQQFFWPALTAMNDSSATWPAYTYSVFPPKGSPDPASSFTYLRQVTARSGNTVTLDAPIPYALDPMHNAIGVRSADLRDQIVITPRSNLGVAGISIDFADNHNGPDGFPSGRGVYLEGVRDAWVYDVQIRNFPASGIVVESSARVTVSNSAVYRTQEYDEGGRGYGVTVDDSQNVLVRSNYVERSRHNFVNRGSLDSLVVFSRNRSAGARANGDDQHYRASHGMLWDRHEMSYGTALLLGYRGDASSEAQESNLSAVVWNPGDDGYRGGSAGGMISLNPSASGHGIVAGGTGTYPVFDDGVEPASGQLIARRTGLQVGAVQQSPSPGSRDRNTLFEGVGQAGLVPESLYDGLLARRIGVAPPDFSTDCRPAPALGAQTPARYAGAGVLVFNEDQLGFSPILGTGCSLNCRIDSIDRNATPGGKYAMLLEMRSAQDTAIGVNWRGPTRSIAQYGSVSLKVYPTGSGLRLGLRLTREPVQGSVVAYKPWTSEALVANRWNTVSVPIGSFGSGTFNALRLWATGSGATHPFYVDDVILR